MDVSGIADEDGLTNASYRYQWVRSNGGTNVDISGHTGSTYTLASADEGKTIKVRVSFTDDADNEETLTSGATATVAAKPNTAATGLPTISGTAQVEQTLTAETSGIADADGLTNVSYSYQWMAGGSDIDGATGSSHVLTSSEKGQTITVRVTFTDDADYQETLTSAATAAVAAKPNIAATGLPTISGTAQVDETLTADTSGISDADGLTNVSYSYQWIRNDGGSDTDIGGQTASTYTLVTADEGKTIKMKVSFTDDADNEETLTSAATAAVAVKPNTPATGAPVITGTAQVDETLTADTSGITDEDGLTNVTFSYQWLADDADIQGDTGSTYTLTDDAVGKVIKVKVTFTDNAGNEESLTSEATAEVTARPNSPATGAPTISGTAQVRETLTADTSPIADEDGLTNVSFSYQWLADDADIGGETASTYTLDDDDVGKVIKVKVTFTDNAGNEESLTSEATAEVEARPNSPATGAPAISGTPQVEQTLTADTSAIADEDGLTNVSYSYQWIAGGSDIAGATGSSYTLTSSEQGQTITVRVTFTDDADNAESLTSAETEPVAAKPNTAATGEPTISGTPQVGETLTADATGIDDADGLTNVSYRYQWVAGGSNISKATGASYLLTASEQGQTIQVKVTFTDDADNQESLTSVATETVAQAPSPLTVSLENAATSHNGTDVFTFEIRFSEQFGLSYKTLRDYAFTVTGGTVNKAKRMTQGSNIGWTITVTPGSAAAVTVVLPVTTGCNASGAVCTADGRKLSNRLEFTVSGPSG